MSAMNSIEWKFKKESPMQGSSDGFWYDITDGGYVRPDQVLSDPGQLKKLNDAIEIVESFEKALEKAGLLNEF